MREQVRRPAGRVELDDAYLGGASARAARVVAARRTRCPSWRRCRPGKPIVACFAPRPFTTAAVAAVARHVLASTAQMVSDGLWWFGAVTQVGATHERLVTGGGASSAKRPQFKAINTVSGNLKTALQDLPCLRLRQVCPSLSGRGAVPLQPPLRSGRHPGPVAAGRPILAALSLTLVQIRNTYRLRPSAGVFRCGGGSVH